MKFLEELKNAKVFTGLSDELRKDIKTERQWAKQGYIALNDECGVMLFSNYNHNQKFRYLHKNEVKEATKEELDSFFAPERKRKNEKAKEARLRKENEQKRVLQEIQEELSLIKAELINGKQSLRSFCKTISSNGTYDYKTSDTIVLDIETTGLSFSFDEILQVSIIDGNNGEVLFNSYIKPFFAQEWKEAQSINKITKEMLEDAPPIYSVLPEIQYIINHADTLIVYNIEFDVSFLKEFGIDFSHIKNFIDVMEDFAVLYGDWDPYNYCFKYQSLSSCTLFFDYDWENEKPHDGIADCRATLYCYNELQKPEYQEKYQKNHLEYYCS